MASSFTRTANSRHNNVTVFWWSPIDGTLKVVPLVNYKIRRRRLDCQRANWAADPFFADELEASLAAAQTDLRPFVQFIVWTGLRLEEMLELHWSDIDVGRRRVWIRRARTGRIEKCSVQFGKTQSVNLPTTMAEAPTSCDIKNLPSRHQR